MKVYLDLSGLPVVVYLNSIYKCIKLCHICITDELFVHSHLSETVERIQLFEITHFTSPTQFILMLPQYLYLLI